MSSDSQVSRTPVKDKPVHRTRKHHYLCSNPSCRELFRLFEKDSATMKCPACSSTLVYQPPEEEQTVDIHGIENLMPLTEPLPSCAVVEEGQSLVIGGRETPPVYVMESYIKRFLQYIGEEPDREGLLNTPSRVIKSWSELFSGYRKDPKDVMTVFEDGACDEMVLLKNIEFMSTCEHHLLPFFGKAHVAYIPNGKVIGVSKLARVLEIYARRLQIQERLCQQVTQALDQHLQPKGSACIIEAQHLCMVCRGVNKQHSIMTTSSVTGVFKNDPSVKNELLGYLK